MDNIIQYLNERIDILKEQLKKGLNSTLDRNTTCSNITVSMIDLVEIESKIKELKNTLEFVEMQKRMNQYDLEKQELNTKIEELQKLKK